MRLPVARFGGYLWDGLIALLLEIAVDHFEEYESFSKWA
jgi:hypothetical protein